VAGGLDRGREQPDRARSGRGQPCILDLEGRSAVTARIEVGNLQQTLNRLRQADLDPPRRGQPHDSGPVEHRPREGAGRAPAVHDLERRAAPDRSGRYRAVQEECSQPGHPLPLECNHRRRVAREPEGRRGPRKDPDQVGNARELGQRVAEFRERDRHSDQELREIMVEVVRLAYKVRNTHLIFNNCDEDKGPAQRHYVHEDAAGAWVKGSVRHSLMWGATRCKLSASSSRSRVSRFRQSTNAGSVTVAARSSASCSIMWAMTNPSKVKKESSSWATADWKAIRESCCPWD